MTIILITIFLNISLLIHYLVYRKEYQDAFKYLPNGDLVPKEQMLKEVKGNRNLGIAVYFMLWFALSALVTFLLYRFSVNTDRQIENLLLPRGSYIYYMVVVMLPCLFLVSNLFELMRNKVPLIYTQVDSSPILYSKTYDKFYLKKYPLFVLIEIVVITVAGLFSFLIYDTYLYAESDQMVINRFFSIQETRYDYDQMSEVEIEFYNDDGSLSLIYVLHFDDDKIRLDDYFSVDSSIQEELFVHQMIVQALETNEEISIYYTAVSDETFNHRIEPLNDVYASLMQQIKSDFDRLSASYIT